SIDLIRDIHSFPTRRSSDLITGGILNLSEQKPIPSTQRALVLQGGGALGAYEAGVFCSIYRKIMNEDKNKNANRMLFDIIAGTSDRKSTRLNSSHQIISYAV